MRIEYEAIESTVEDSFPTHVHAMERTKLSRKILLLSHKKLESSISHICCFHYAFFASCFSTFFIEKEGKKCRCSYIFNQKMSRNALKIDLCSLVCLSDKVEEKNLFIKMLSIIKLCSSLYNKSSRIWKRLFQLLFRAQKFQQFSIFVHNVCYCFFSFALSFTTSPLFFIQRTRCL